jgi:hypothetical protein
VKKHLLAIVLISVTLTTPATAQSPTYKPLSNWDAIPKRPGPGGANTFICTDWLSKHAARFNELAGPGGRDPVIKIYGPTATRGSFGAMNVACFLTLLHRAGDRLRVPPPPSRGGDAASVQRLGDAGVAPSDRATVSSHQTRWWREVDSNSRSRIKRSPLQANDRGGRRF